jgi:class 3 adenylate cyclase
MDLAPYEEQGLYDPDAAGADGQRQLLELLVANGVTIEEMVAANTEHRLPFVLGDRLIRPDRAHLTLADVAERVSMPPDRVQRIWRALGFAERTAGDPEFSETDVRVIQMITVLIANLGDEGAIQLSRVIGSSLARIAEAGFTIGLSQVEGGHLASATSLVEAARAAETLGVLSQAAPALFDPVFRRHIESVARRWDSAPSDDPETATRAIGFADLVGFTAMSNVSSVDEVTNAVNDLEEIALDAASAAGGKIVKLIGDEVMFVAATADAGCEIALRVLDGASQHPTLPSMRASLAFGLVVPFAGDYFGPVVNLASRLTSEAEPDQLLISEEAAAAIDPARYAVGAAASVTLRGFADPVRAVAVRTHDTKGAG